MPTPEPTHASALTSHPIFQTLRSFADRAMNGDDKTLRWVLGALVLVLACFNFLRDLNNPNHAFWDESYYLTATQRYVEDTAQYASHPPLGFMFMDLGVSTIGRNEKLDLHPLAVEKKIDTRKLAKGYDFTGVRLPAAIFSVISAMLFYLIMLRLSNEAFDAFVFSLLYLFENAFIVHFRAAHLDPYQFTFTLASIYVWLFTWDREPKRPLLTYGLFGLFCGLSFMVKVNSLVMLALGGFSLLRMLWLDRNRETAIRFLTRGTAVAASFAAIVAAIFALHVVLNPNMPDPKTESGRRDLKVMPQSYQAWLGGKAPLTPAVVWDATAGYYTYMKHDFQYVTKNEPNGAKAILFPFMNKIINYRWDFNGRKTAYVQMVGNPVNWGLGIVGIAAAAVLILRRRTRRRAEAEDADMDLLEVMFAMFILFWGLHIYLGSQRVMYIYHYFIGLALSYFLVALSFKVVSRRVAFVARHRFSILCATSIAIAGSFLFYSPLTYHYFLSRKECQMRNWPVTLVICQPIKTKPAASPAPATPPPTQSR